MKNYNKTLTISKNAEYIIIITFIILYISLDYISIGLMKLVNNKDFFSPVPLFTLTMYIVQIATITIIYFLIAPNILKKINWKRILIAIVLSYATFIAIRYFIEQFLTSLLFNSVNYFKETPLSFYIYDNLHFGSFIVFSTLLIWTILYLFKTLQQNNIIEQQKKNAEIEFLKAQINPHFLFNTLNNIYSLVQFKPDSALKGIENLSSIMRFTTYETNKDQIEIEKEINYIQQYLALEKLRFGEQFFVEFEINIINKHQHIYPYLISPLIENALKHGIVKDYNHPINININLDSEFCRVEVKNKINTNQKDSTTGIGLENLRKRLDFYFGKSYVLDLNSDENMFNVELKFPVNE